jgi:uncharacterized membrane protein
MEKEYIGYTLTILGIALITIGALNVAGYLSFQTVDTTPPQILYSYPQDKMVYKATEIDEYVLYVQDKESAIMSATYTDKYVGTVSLLVTPYTQLKHPWVIVGIKYPDVNFDGRVDSTDIDLINSAVGKSYLDPDWNLYSKYDINNDNKVDTKDVLLAINYTGTVTFSLKSTTSYPVRENVTFAFTATSLGGANSIQGTFQIQDYAPLSGVWRINGQVVNASSAIELEGYKATVSFECTDSTVKSSLVTVTAELNNVVYPLQLTGTNVWSIELSFSQGVNTMILEAKTPDKINKITVQVITPKQPTITVGHVLIIAGAVLIATGIVVVKREEEIW